MLHCLVYMMCCYRCLHTEKHHCLMFLWCCVILVICGIFAAGCIQINTIVCSCVCYFWLWFIGIVIAVCIQLNTIVYSCGLLCSFGYMWYFCCWMQTDKHHMFLWCCCVVLFIWDVVIAVCIQINTIVCSCDILLALVYMWRCCCWMHPDKHLVMFLWIVVLSCLYGCVVIALCIQINTIVCSCDVVELFFWVFFSFFISCFFIVWVVCCSLFGVLVVLVVFCFFISCFLLCRCYIVLCFSVLFYFYSFLLLLIVFVLLWWFIFVVVFLNIFLFYIWLCLITAILFLMIL